MQPKISIIIPFYNVDKYIDSCLKSIYNQDITENDFEVICVNDGSMDNSRNIVVEYQKKHRNLILLEHECNKKLGTARNTGRAIARGKYIWNVDSDDYISDNCLKCIIDQCESNELEILMFNIASFTDTKVVVEDFLFSSCGVVKEGLICLDENISLIGCFCPVWRYVYSKKFLDSNSIFSPEINMGEDVPYAFKSLILSKRVMLVNNVYYYYRINPSSLTNIKILSPIMLYEKSFIAARLVHNLLKIIPKQYTELNRSIKNMIRYIMFVYPDYLMKMSTLEKKVFFSICRKHFFEDVRLFCSINKSQKIEYVKCLLGL